VTFTTTIAGDVATFDADSYTANLAATLDGVDAADITLNVSAASVRVSALIVPSSVDVAQMAMSTLQGLSTTELSESLKVTVESVEAPTLVLSIEPVASNPPSLPDLGPQGLQEASPLASIAGIIAIAVVAVLVAILIAYLCVRCKWARARSRVAKEPASNPVDPTEPAAHSPDMDVLDAVGPPDTDAPEASHRPKQTGVIARALAVLLAAIREMCKCACERICPSKKAKAARPPRKRPSAAATNAFVDALSGRARVMGASEEGEVQPEDIDAEVDDESASANEGRTWEGILEEYGIRPTGSSPPTWPDLIEDASISEDTAESATPRAPPSTSASPEETPASSTSASPAETPRAPPFESPSKSPLKFILPERRQHLGEAPISDSPPLKSASPQPHQPTPALQVVPVRPAPRVRRWSNHGPGSLEELSSLELRRRTMVTQLDKGLTSIAELQSDAKERAELRLALAVDDEGSHIESQRDKPPSTRRTSRSTERERAFPGGSPNQPRIQMEPEGWGWNQVLDNLGDQPDTPPSSRQTALPWMVEEQEDSSDTISQAELKEYMMLRGYSAEQIVAAIQALDTDGDGQIHLSPRESPTQQQQQRSQRESDQGWGWSALLDNLSA